MQTKLAASVRNQLLWKTYLGNVSHVLQISGTAVRKDVKPALLEKCGHLSLRPASRKPMSQRLWKIARVVST